MARIKTYPRLHDVSDDDLILVADMSEINTPTRSAKISDLFRQIEITNNNISSSAFQGYYALLSSVYFGGSSTSAVINTDGVNAWTDVILNIDTQGLFDYRPVKMKDAQAIGHLGDGSLGSPICFKLEGLTQTASCSLRAAIKFDPDEDGGRLDSRLLFKRHSGTTPSDDFSIEATSVAMESGADTLYSNTPNIQFFIGDTIDTNGTDDAGTIQFQIKTDVAGTVYVDELALFIQA
jgi:hypothetical protein